MTLRVGPPFYEGEEEYYLASITLEHPEEGEIAEPEGWMLETLYHGIEQLKDAAKQLERGVVHNFIARSAIVRKARYHVNKTDQVNEAAKIAVKMTQEKKED